MNPMLAIQYIQNNGNPIELARLNFLLHDQPASAEIVEDFCASQNGDGSWSPFWLPDFSSLDATCFHLAQAQQLGMDIKRTGDYNCVRFYCRIDRKMMSPGKKNYRIARLPLPG